MMNAAESRTILVRPLGMDERKLAILRMAFRMHHALDFQLQIPELPEAELAIIDVDSPAGWQVWDAFQASHPALPALIVTAFPCENAPAPLLPKPIRVETLFPALQALLDADKKPARPAPIPAPASGIVQQPVQIAIADKAAPAAPSIHRQPAPIRPPQEWPQGQETFNPDLGLYGALTRLYAQRKSAELHIGQQVVIRFYPAEERAFLCVSPSALARLCTDTKLHPRLVPAKPSTDYADAASQSASALLWQVALWSARGRLPIGLGANSMLGLQHWPNLTRLAEIPGAMRMAAFWTRTPASPKLALRMLGVDIADICNFLAASLALGLLDTSRTPLRPHAPATRVPPADPAGLGLLSRLLSRIRGDQPGKPSCASTTTR